MAWAELFAVQVHKAGHGNCSRFQRLLLKLAFGHPSAASLCPHSQIASLVPPFASPTLAGDMDPRSEENFSPSQHPHLKAQGGKGTMFVPICLQSTGSLVCFQFLPQDPGFISTHDCLEQGPESPEEGSSALHGAEQWQHPCIPAPSSSQDIQQLSSTKPTCSHVMADPKNHSKK